MNKIVIVVVVVTIIAVGGYFWLRSRYQAPSSGITPQPLAQETLNQATPSATIPTPNTQKTSLVEKSVVTYTDAGYSPNTLSVKVGETVTWKNQSSQAMWTASAVHPSHTAYGGTSLGTHCPDISKTAFDTCTGVQPGNSWSFAFTKKGTWKYHNHLNPGDTGTIVVE